jgi:MFS transporter, PPP family, 3-phenylpropionic acid transporter
MKNKLKVEWWSFAAVSATYFAHVGFFGPYLPLWLKQLGYGVTAIGWLTAIQAATRLFAPYVWSWLSDRTGERVRWLRFCAAVALICSLGFFVSVQFAWLMIVLLFMFIHTSAMMPMTETLMAQWVSSDKGFDSRRYGRIRLWGSLGFMLTALLSGAWFEAHGMTSFPLWVVVSLVVLNLSVWWIPSRHDGAGEKQIMPAVGEVLRQSKVRWLLLSVFFHVLSHMGIYVFFSLYLDSLGYSKTTIGFMWAASVSAEILWFMFHSRWLHWMSLSAWLILCSAVMVLRMLLTTVWADVLWILIFAQIMHALTFAMHHSACVSLLSEFFPARLRARGQALYSSLGYGLPGVLGAVLGGYLSEALGLQMVFAACATVAGLAVFCSWHLRHALCAADVLSVDLAER